MDPLQVDEARRLLAEERAARLLAESRLALSDNVTRAALAAPDYKSAMAECLRLFAEHVGADCAFARGLAPHSGWLEVEAHYLSPDAAVLAGVVDHFLVFPVTRGKSIVAATIFEQRPLVVRDTALVDHAHYPLVGVAHRNGINALFSVPCENAGARYALTFLFRRPPAELAARCDTVVALSGRVRDLLARKEAEDRIALLQSVVLHTGDAVIVAEAGAPATEAPRIIYVNPAFSALTLYAAAEVVGRSVVLLLGPRSEHQAIARLRRAAARIEPQTLEMHVHRKDGSPFWAEIVATPASRFDGRHGRWIAVLRDRTERRRIEDALRHSQKMEAVGQLTGGIAHDFNNMLTVIAGNLELLEGKLAHESRLLRHVNAAALAANRAERLTQQLLTFSRRQRLRPQPVDFNQTVVGMGELMRRTVGERIDIRLLLAPDLWPARADPNQLEAALLNLVLNARDALPEGGRIALETANMSIERGSEELAPGDYATLSVTDNGVGMSKHVLAHVFEPFFTTKAVGKGTGLGLPQVYGFIRQSAGHVQIESREGAGTTVRLYLPRAREAVAFAAAPPQREESHRGSETVLVVEDDVGVREFAAAVLRELGYRVLEAENGDHAITVLDRHPDIALLFTDVVMPGRLGGAELARVAQASRPALRVLFTSGYTNRSAEALGPAGGLEFLRKPYRSLDLAERVRAILDRRAKA